MDPIYPQIDRWRPLKRTAYSWRGSFLIRRFLSPAQIELARVLICQVLIRRDRSTTHGGWTWFPALACAMK